MVKRVLASCDGHEITAEFENTDEYRRFCDVIANECVDCLMKNMTLDDTIKLWLEKNKNKSVPQ